MPSLSLDVLLITVNKDFTSSKKCPLLSRYDKPKYYISLIIMLSPMALSKNYLHSCLISKCLILINVKVFVYPGSSYGWEFSSVRSPHISPNNSDILLNQTRVLEAEQL